MPAGGWRQGTVLDRMVAVVNGDVILESDVDEERRFESIQPYRGSSRGVSRERGDPETDRQNADSAAGSACSRRMRLRSKTLDAQLAKLRKDIPACKQYHCETDAGWQKFLADHGFTVEEFRDAVAEADGVAAVYRGAVPEWEYGYRMTRSRTYYEKTMLPEYAKQKVTPPKLETISKRIEEVLLQQQVGSLLQDWLKSLRAQGSVRIMNADEVAP